MTNFWHIIVQSNTLNFSILVIIIAVVLSKIDLQSLIEKIRFEIASSIENAEKLKNDALKELKEMQTTASMTDIEINDKLANAKNNAKLLSKEITQNAKKQIQQIENNIQRIISSEKKIKTTKVSQNTVNNAIDLAKTNLIKLLDTDPTLHNKFIEESLTELDKIKL